MSVIASFFLNGGNAFNTSSSPASSGEVKVNDESDNIYADSNLTLQVGKVTRHTKVSKFQDGVLIKNVTVNFHMTAGDLVGNGFRFTAAIPTPSLVGSVKSSLSGTWGNILYSFKGYVVATDLGNGKRRVDLYPA